MKNWSGSLRFTPGEFYQPFDELELAEIVRDAAGRGQRVRVAGAAHSSTPLLVTGEVLVSLKHFTSMESDENHAESAWVGTGLTVGEGGKKLMSLGLTFHNTGDVDVQTLAGAIGTGTHGTGIRLRNLSSMLTGCRMVCADGEVRTFRIEEDGSDFFRAIRVSMGSFGIMTGMRLKLMPAYRLDRREWCVHVDDCLEHLNEFIHGNRNFDFYWYPRCDLVKLRTFNEPGQGMKMPDFARLVEHDRGWAIEVLAKTRDLRFDEIEYHLPVEAGPECFREVRRMIRETFRKNVAWRVLYRTIASDDNWLSPCYRRDTATISLHQNAGLPFWRYFRAIEPVFRDFGGRPHWGKKHTLRWDELRRLYEKWDDFHRIRKRMDPDDMFLNRYLESLFLTRSQLKS